MDFHIVDLLIIFGYLVGVAAVGFVIRKQATKKLDSFYLADRNIPWWMLGISGSSSYIDIGGTMALVGAMFFLGLQAIWMTHIFWGWLIICFFMAFQAKYIRRSGVMTFAEWNKTRFGEDRDAEMARVAAATFLLILMIANLMFIAVGTGKFAEEFLPFDRWVSVAIVFGVVGLYVTLGGFFGVIITDIIQTFLIFVGAILLSIYAFGAGDVATMIAGKAAAWSDLAPQWTLWSGYLKEAPETYHHYYFFGPMLMAGFSWLIFRVLSGPNVWDFQFFLTTRSARDASLAAGMWTVGYTLRWVIACAFMVLGFFWLDTSSGFDGEKIMPLVLKNLPVGMQGMLMAILLAALMSTLSAMINVTSSVITNDFIKRYLMKHLTEKQAVRWGQFASILAITLGFVFSLGFDDVVTAWETMIFVVVTMILVPATFRWHWWRYSAKAFVWGMIVTAAIIVVQKTFFTHWHPNLALAFNIWMSFIACIYIGFIFTPTDKEVLIRFYSSVRPFGVWGPIRRECEARGLTPANDKMPTLDILNGLMTVVFQVSLALIPFFAFLEMWDNFAAWIGVFFAVGLLLYFTWYKTLPAREEG
jgi:solute:Na+ symporter, SSS family